MHKSTETSFRLFASVDEAVWQIGTIPLFRALFDNYDAVRCSVKLRTALIRPGDRPGPGRNEMALAETKTPWRPHIATFDS